MDSIKLRIADNFYFDNAELLLPSIKDSAGKPLRSGIESWLTQTYSLTPKERKEKGVVRSGYDAKQLNKALRERMNEISGIHGETCVMWNALVSKGNKGFDFSIFDEEYNIIKLRNYFVGDPGQFKGAEKIRDIGKNVFSSTGKTYKSKEWKAKLSTLIGVEGTNIDGRKSRYTIVGELQFGNWALAEHDLLRLMNSSLNGEIDYYIYITATGELEKKLSAGIVTYTKVLELFKKNKPLFRTPIWVIGLDIDRV